MLTNLLSKGGFLILRWIGGIIVLGWLLGLVFKIGGGAIHILLVIAAIAFVIDFMQGRA